jgi:hypothetical protein
MGSHSKWVGVCLFALFVSTTASAAKKDSFFALDIGAYMTHVDKRLDAGANGSNVSTLAAFFRARKLIPLMTGFGWEPSVGLLLPWRSGGDGFAKTFIMHAAFGVGITPLSWLHLRLGPGLLWRLTIANAEQVTLNNGTGNSGFYIPGGSRSVFQFTADAGIDFRLLQSVSLGLDVWVVEIASSSRRTFNAAASLGFYL